MSSIVLVWPIATPALLLHHAQDAFQDISYQLKEHARLDALILTALNASPSINAISVKQDTDSKVLPASGTSALFNIVLNAKLVPDAKNVKASSNSPVTLELAYLVAE